MKRIYIFLTFTVLFFSIQCVGQQRSLGFSTNVEFNNVQNNLSAPVLMPGVFYQFPIGKRIAISSGVSFGKNKFISRNIDSRLSQTVITTTQYYESSTTWDQSLKLYVSKKSNDKKPNFYCGWGYSIRSPKLQLGEVKTTRIEEFPKRINIKNFPRQHKINFIFGADYFLDHKFFLSMEAGFQMPIFEADESSYPILAGGDMLFLNLKVGVHLYKIIFYPRENREDIHINDLQIKN